MRARVEHDGEKKRAVGVAQVVEAQRLETGGVTRPLVAASHGAREQRRSLTCGFLLPGRIPEIELDGVAQPAFAHST
jgi:hypothetical protein